MSWLLFRRSQGLIELFEGTPPAIPHDFIGPPIGSWPAHNDTTSSSEGPWPDGVFDWSHYNAHEEMGFAPGCYATAYGCEGIHVFEVDGRAGMGVHAGRTHGEPGHLGGKTLGCIRVPADAMTIINSVHNADPLVKIESY